MSGGLHAWMMSNGRSLPHLEARAALCAPSCTRTPTRTRETLGLGRGLVLVDVDPVEVLARRVTRALRADHADVVAAGDQRLALEPHPPVERDREVLDDDQDVRSRAAEACGRVGRDGRCPCRDDVIIQYAPFGVIMTWAVRHMIMRSVMTDQFST